MPRPLTYAQYQTYAQHVRAIADRVSRSLIAQARVAAKDAGLDPTICFLHAHNALCSYEYGKPWPEVDYSLARKVLWLERQSWEPSRLADAISRRAMSRIVWES